MPISIVNEKKRIISNILIVTVVVGAITVVMATLRDIEMGIPLINTIVNGGAVFLFVIILANRSCEIKREQKSSFGKMKLDEDE